MIAEAGRQQTEQNRLSRDVIGEVAELRPGIGERGADDDLPFLGADPVSAGGLAVKTVSLNRNPLTVEGTCVPKTSQTA